MHEPYAIVPSLASAVLLAHDVNQSIFTADWLLTNGVLNKEDLSGVVAVAPGMTQVQAPGFELLVLPDRIQWRPARNSKTQVEDLRRVVCKVAALLPHTPFHAFGHNFEYFVSPTAGMDFASWQREFLASKWANQEVEPSIRQARFGCNYTTFELDCRVAVAINPVAVKSLVAAGVDAGDAVLKDGEHVHLKVNFHRELKGDIPSAINQMVELRSKAKDYAEAVALRLARSETNVNAN